MKTAEIRQARAGQKNEARSMAMYLMRNRKGYPLKEIAKWLNLSNEYAVAQALRRFNLSLKKDRKLAKRIRELEKYIMG